MAEVTELSPNLTSVDLVEVFHLGDTPRRSVLANWSSESGLGNWDVRSIFLRRGDWQGMQLNVVSIQVRVGETLVTGESRGDIYGHVPKCLKIALNLKCLDIL